MATKDELVAFAHAHGIAIDESALKADMEAAIADAGYDPTNLEPREAAVSDEGTTSAEELAETIATTSSDARFSTYTPVDPDPEERPAPGPMVEQTRGEPSED